MGQELNIRMKRLIGAANGVRGGAVDLGTAAERLAMSSAADWFMGELTMAEAIGTARNQIDYMVQKLGPWPEAQQ